MTQNTNNLDKLYYLIADFQRSNRFFLNAQDLDLSLLESRVLTDLAALPKLRGLDLAKYLQLSATQISRVLKKLENKKYIKQVVSEEDSRFKDIILSKKGLAQLVDHDKKSNLRLELLEKNLKASEKLEFRKLIKKFSAGFKLLYPEYKRNEHVLRSSIRRITQALGMLDRRIFGFEDLSSLEWQVLISIEKSNSGIIAKDLAKYLDIPANSLSYVIKRLSAIKLVHKLVGFDQRLSILALSPEGVDYLREIKLTATSQLSLALSKFNLKEQAQLVNLMEKFLFGSKKSSGMSEYDVQLLRDEASLGLIREFCLLNLVRLNLAPVASFRIIDPSSSIYAIYDSGKLLACLEIQKSNNTTSELLNYVYSREFDYAKLEADFIKQAVADCLKKRKVKEIRMESYWLKNTDKFKKYYDKKLKGYLFVKGDDL